MLSGGKPDPAGVYIRDNEWGVFGADCEAMIPDLTERERRRELIVIDGGNSIDEYHGPRELDP